jgi:selenide,water dikinase
MEQMEPIRLTQYSHGAGCGCKISPQLLEKILHTSFTMPDNDRLLVGNHSKDDAAVYDLGNNQCLISTTDFFMPIVDDPYNFGRIAAANAISDVYAMGGKPILAIAILGWPISKLSPEIASKVIEGGRSICIEAGIPLAGGHSIDSPEPIFGLAVNGLVEKDRIKQNNTAKENDILFLTKKIGVGILTTAEKKGLLKKEHQGLAAEQMMQLNKIGEELGKLTSINAMTDVTGFGVLGHLIEMAEGSGLTAELSLSGVPRITPDLEEYITNDSVPGGTHRNLASYGHKCIIGENDQLAKAILADPQTSGGLLIAVEPSGIEELKAIFKKFNIESFAVPIGKMEAKSNYCVRVIP